MSTQRPSIHQTQSWVNTALSFICLLFSWVCMSHCFTQFIHSSTDGKCNKMVHWMLMDSEECLGETHFVLCLKPRKEIISGCLEWIYIVFHDAIYANLTHCHWKQKEVQNQHIHLFIWKCFYPEWLTIEGYGLCSRARIGSATMLTHNLAISSLELLTAELPLHHLS